VDLNHKDTKDTKKAKEMVREDLVFRIEKLLGSRLESYQAVVGGGYTPAARLLCRTGSANFFVKIGTTPLTSQFIRREIDVYNRIRGEFMPRLIACEDREEEPILVIEDLSGKTWPPPWSRSQIDLVVAQIDVMHNTPADLEPFAEVHGALNSGWQAVAADPEPFLSLGIASRDWLETALPNLIRAEELCSTEGDCLTHWDLRSDNICLTQQKAVFVDWNLACLSNPRLDLGFWLPSLAYEGGVGPESILPDAPEVAAWVSGFFAARAGLPVIPDAPRVRQVQLRQLETALPWAIRALELRPG